MVPDQCSTVLSPSNHPEQSQSHLTPPTKPQTTSSVVVTHPGSHSNNDTVTYIPYEPSLPSVTQQQAASGNMQYAPNTTLSTQAVPVSMTVAQSMPSPNSSNSIKLAVPSNNPYVKLLLCLGF